ncbi:MAG TPA: disulfide bond formation protein B [Accumulibacter sp.]|nr:disulfide bond formation protein B [Accumulibacter sp.]
MSGRFSLRAGFGLLATAAVAMTAVAVLAGEWLRLQACPLCIFQRVLYLAIAVVAIVGVLLPAGHRFLGVSIALLSIGGVATAGYQSWLQLAPDTSMACGAGEPNVIEQVVDWLGMRWPRLFMATGFCSSKEWVVLGLSMANWSGLGFLAFGLAAARLARRQS